VKLFEVSLKAEVGLVFDENEVSMVFGLVQRSVSVELGRLTYLYRTVKRSSGLASGQWVGPCCRDMTSGSARPWAYGSHG
jgi:hypothetical protein